VIVGHPAVARLAARRQALMDAVYWLTMPLEDSGETSEVCRRQKLRIALDELNAATARLHDFHRQTDPQFFKEEAITLYTETRDRGITPRDAISVLVLTMAAREYEDHGKLLELGAVLPDPPRYAGYATGDVIGALANAVEAATRRRERRPADERKTRKAKLMEKLLQKHPQASKAELRTRAQKIKGRTRSGASAADEYVLQAARAVGATTTMNAATYQSQVRAALRALCKEQLQGRRRAPCDSSRCADSPLRKPNPLDGGAGDANDTGACSWACASP
jgi:hypothetical protein